MQNFLPTDATFSPGSIFTEIGYWDTSLKGSIGELLKGPLVTGHLVIMIKANTQNMYHPFSVLAHGRHC